MDGTIKFTKDEVRNHLSELGYANIEDSKLDEFCRDLKRLIKYEEKQKNIGRKLEQLELLESNLSENKENEDSSISSVDQKVQIYIWPYLIFVSCLLYTFTEEETN